MDPGAIAFQLIIGIATAMLYWIVSSGLTFTFGVTRILNFAHGAFYMLGAYFTLLFLKSSETTWWRCWSARYLWD
jgi:branched-subunit amino acid ABC-type transport system permease component